MREEGLGADLLPLRVRGVLHKKSLSQGRTEAKPNSLQERTNGGEAEQPPKEGRMKAQPE